MRLDEKTRQIIKGEVASQHLVLRAQVACRLAACLLIKVGGRKVDVLTEYLLEPHNPFASRHYDRESFYEHGANSDFDSNLATHGSLRAGIARTIRLDPTGLRALRSILR